MAAPKPNPRRVYARTREPTTGVNFSSFNCTPTGSGAPAGTAFVNSGAQVLTNVHVQLIFWGVQWAGSPNQLATQVISAVQGLLSGPYMSELAQYGVHRGSLLGTTFVADEDPPNPFSYTDVSDFVIRQLDNDNLPEPDSDWPIAYCVLMPANVAFAGDSRVDKKVPLPAGTLSGVVGANSNIVWHDYDLGDVDNDPAHYLWVGCRGAAATQANVDYITSVFSHELAEMCTDPNGGDGIVQVGGAGGLSQIGDPCTNLCDYVRGVRVQSYWSQLDGRCIVPKMYSVRRTLAGAGKQINGRLRSLQSPIASANVLISSLF